MIRHGNLFESITDIETLRYAYQMSRRGKSHYTAVKRFERNVDANLKNIQQALIDKTFKTGGYKIEDRMEGGKMRRIYKLPYSPDRIVQHALMSVVGPIIRRSLIRDTFQSLPERGTADARRRVQKFIKANQPRYALKLDIRKYYPSVNNDRLKQMVRRKIKCPDTLWLIDDILDSMDGLPIGNLTSQYFGNFYLYQFDWWVKQGLGVGGYYRYCDDLILFANSKAQLRAWFYQIESKLNGLELDVKPDWQIVPMQKQGVDFVGFVFMLDKTKLRPSIARNFKTASKKKTGLELFASLIAYKGWMMRANAKMLWRKHVSGRIIKQSKLFYKHTPLRGRI